jgi:hypothetical protein
MIHIDFQGGTHGNYLEFVCNLFISTVIVSLHLSVKLADAG